MYPHERSLVKQLADKPFAIVGVNSDPDREEIQETLRKKNLTWRSFWNGPRGTGGPISTEWGVQGWPTIYVLDKEGRIRFKDVRGNAMDKAIETLMAEMGHEVSIKHEKEEEKKKDDEDDEDDSESKSDKGNNSDADDKSDKGVNDVKK